MGKRRNEKIIKLTEYKTANQTCGIYSAKAVSMGKYIARMLILENLKESNKNLLELSSEFSKITGYKIDK